MKIGKFDLSKLDLSKEALLELTTKGKILKCKHYIFTRFDKESTYRELNEDTARAIVSAGLDKLHKELDGKEDITDENRTS